MHNYNIQSPLAGIIEIVSDRDHMRQLRRKVIRVLKSTLRSRQRILCRIHQIDRSTEFKIYMMMKTDNRNSYIIPQKRRLRWHPRAGCGIILGRIESLRCLIF